MEISPVTGISVMPAAKVQSEQAGLTAYFYIDSSARSGDDRYSGGGKSAAGADEDEHEESAESLETQPDAMPGEDGSVSSINYFA
jgi:hypothetical protein